MGDVVLLPGDKGAHVLVLRSEEVVSKVMASLERVRSVPVVVAELALPQVHQRPAGLKEMTVVEASARLDAVGKRSNPA